MQKTIKEKEFLQKRTNELLLAMQHKPLNPPPSIRNDPTIIHKGTFVISEIRSDVDNQTYISDNSQKTQTSQFTTSNSIPQSNMSGIMKGF